MLSRIISFVNLYDTKIILNNLGKFIKKHKKDIILVIGVILISLFSFAAGYITAKTEKKGDIIIEEIKINEEA